MIKNSNSTSSDREKQKCFNAGIFGRSIREIKEVLIVADADNNGKINNKIPGGMQEGSHTDAEQWLADTAKHLIKAGFSTMQINAIMKHELMIGTAGNGRTENERGVIHEIAEEVGLYAAEVEHVHFQTGKGNVRQNFFFVKAYIVPENPPQVFESNDKDVKKKMWLSTDELLFKEEKTAETKEEADAQIYVSQKVTTIFHTHRQALEKYMEQMEDEDWNSIVITVEDLVS